MRQLRLWRQLVAALMALAWTPMIHSCEIAHALGLELPQQGEYSQSGQPPVDNCDHCNFCETMNAGGVPPAVVKVTVPGLVALIPVWQPALAALVPAPPVSLVTSILRSDQDCPPQRWQFAERTALPPRAPSLLA